MRKFGYLVMMLGEEPAQAVQDRFEEAGSFGWELVAVNDRAAFFKREIVETSVPDSYRLAMTDFEVSSWRERYD